MLGVVADTHAEVWHQLKGKERAAALRDTCERLENQQTSRVARWQRNLSVYEGRLIAGLNPDSYYASGELAGAGFDRLRVNLARSITNAAVAKIGGKQRPKVQFCVSDGDWSLKRRAKRLERIVEAVMMQRHQGHHDAWSVHLLALRDCCVCDVGAVKWWADPVQRRVTCSRVLPWEILVDPYEARYASPRNLFHVYGYDRFMLAEQFPTSKDEIMGAPALIDRSGQTSRAYATADIQRMVKVSEGWRLPDSPEKPGRHSLVVGEIDLVADGDGDWDRPFFPFELLVWEPWLMGLFGTGIVDNVYAVNDEYNCALERWATAERRGSNVFIACEKDSVPKQDIESNQPFIIVEYEKGRPPPTMIVPETQGNASQNWQGQLKNVAYEVSGQSQMSATGQVEQGITAAIAMRTKETIATERFGPQWQMYERIASVGAARQIVAGLRELAQKDENFAIKWPGGSYLREIKWSDANLEDDQYEAQPYAVSGLVNTPADRLQLASELLDRQLISRDAFLRVIQYKNIDEEIAGASRQSEMLERMVEEWFDADPDEIQAFLGGQPVEDAKFEYWPPEPFMQLEDAIVQLGRGYFQARLDRAPDPILSLFLRYIGECDAEVKKQQEFLASLQGGGAAPPGGPPPAGAPPA